MNDIMKRLKALETRRNARYGVLYPDDSDGFCAAYCAGGQLLDTFRRKGGGFDMLAVIAARAAEDWKDDIPEVYDDEETDD